MAVLPAADSPRVSQGAAAGPGGTSDPQAPAAGSTATPEGSPASGKPLSSAQNSPPSLVPERRVAGGHPDHSPGAGDQRPHLHRAHEFPLPGLARWGVEHGQRCEPAPPRPGSLLGGPNVCRRCPPGRGVGERSGGPRTSLEKGPRASGLVGTEEGGERHVWCCVCTPPRPRPRKCPFSIAENGWGARRPHQASHGRGRQPLGLVGPRENTCSSWAPGQAGNPDARSSHEAQAGAFVQMFSLPSRLPLSSYLTVSY